MNEYSKTVNLPQTSFQMRANLSQSEPKWIDFWKNMRIHEKLKEKNIQSKSFILHDGPPYANGHLHLGHALNKILKDIICRINFKLGYNVNFVPGWDCHGLPIEWEVEENYRKKKKSKEDIDVISFREECRNFAKKWIDIQCEEFIRLGLDYDWKNKYTTMHRDAEATIVSELLKFLEKGILYLGKKPVMWSVVEKTALAEAEIEYLEKNSKSIFVKFPIKKNDNSKFQNCSVAIWTTTPWTLPGNMAIAYSNSIEYQIITFSQDYPNFKLNKGESLIFSKKLFKSFSNENKIKNYKIEDKITGSELSKILCSHPLAGLGYEHTIPLIEGFHVTDDTGTGFVHIAPGHGVEDFEIGQKNNLGIPRTVMYNGIFEKTVPEFSGIHVFKADKPIIEKLEESNNLICVNDFLHSYPHSWRSKAPLIFRTTSQWFISMDKEELRKKALKEIEKVNWIPSTSRNRIRSMVLDRPDWCVSRQRSWGVPITIFIDKKTFEPLINKNLNSRIISIIKEKGADAWFSEPKKNFLGNEFDSEKYEKVTDILDVWFDSGSSHVFVLKNKGLNQKSDLYLEGSDQHRGWFQSSLLESCAIYDQSPFKSVLTHGFVLDENGKKMSKSLGNVISPQDIVKKYGADILRLWVASSNYNEDLKISFESLDRQSENYRKIRNSIRFILGNLKEWDPNEKVEHNELPELERYIRHRLYTLNEKIISSYKNYNFHQALKEISNFCNQDLSTIFFDIRKDYLYCESKDSLSRKAVRTVLVDIFYNLVSWLSPLLPFTTEEAWQCWREEIIKEEIISCHLMSFSKPNQSWNDLKLEKNWNMINEIRSTVSYCIEKMREDKKIKSSLEAKVSICVEDENYKFALQKINLEEVLITSFVEVVTKKDTKFINLINEKNAKIFVKVDKFDGEKCDRCWKLFHKKNLIGEICKRCYDAHSKG